MKPDIAIALFLVFTARGDNLTKSYGEQARCALDKTKQLFNTLTVTVRHCQAIDSMMLLAQPFSCRDLTIAHSTSKCQLCCRSPIKH